MFDNLTVHWLSAQIDADAYYNLSHIIVHPEDLAATHLTNASNIRTLLQQGCESVNLSSSHGKSVRDNWGASLGMIVGPSGTSELGAMQVPQQHASTRPSHGSSSSSSRARGAIPRSSSWAPIIVALAVGFIAGAAVFNNSSSNSRRVVADSRYSGASSNLDEAFDATRQDGVHVSARGRGVYSRIPLRKRVPPSAQSTTTTTPTPSTTTDATRSPTPSSSKRSHNNIRHRGRGMSTTDKETPVTATSSPLSGHRRTPSPTLHPFHMVELTNLRSVNSGSDVQKNAIDCKEWGCTCQGLSDKCVFAHPPKLSSITHTINTQTQTHTHTHTHTRAYATTPITATTTLTMLQTSHTPWSICTLQQHFFSFSDSTRRQSTGDPHRTTLLTFGNSTTAPRKRRFPQRHFFTFSVRLVGIIIVYHLTSAPRKPRLL